MKQIRLTLVGILLFAIWGLGVAQPLIERPQLVDTEWLARNLNNPNLRVIDARGMLLTYLQEHIPNAIFLSTETLRISRGGIPGQLLPPERLAEIFGAMGIGSSMRWWFTPAWRMPLLRRPIPRLP